jgi:hypothetical protein
MLYQKDLLCGNFIHKREHNRSNQPATLKISHYSEITGCSLNDDGGGGGGCDDTTTITFCKNLKQKIKHTMTD